MALSSDHDLLVEVHTILTRLDKTVNGNGRPGLLQDHTALQQSHDSLVEEVHEIRNLVPSRKEKVVGISAVIAAGVTSLGSIVVAWIARG